ncbi:MAG: amidohydrolase family protein [Pseudomonadota bacterium]
MLGFQGAKVFNGRAVAEPLTDVLVEGNTIKAVGQGVIPPGTQTIDGTGMTLMPGMVEGHCHPSFTGVGEPPELGRITPERHMLLTAQNLRLLLDCGFTSIFEAASAKPLLGVTARDAINEGLIKGPRMRAGSPEVTNTAGLGDERRRHMHQESFGLIADGPDEMRRVARECVRDTVDVMKINISGDEFVSHARAEITPLEDEELAAFVKVARAFHKTTACHARSSQSVKMAVRHGLDCIYHCDFADEEALDMLESVKDTVFVGPAFGLVHNCVHEGESVGMSPDVVESLGLYRKFEHTVATLTQIRKRGLRVVVGGDYGFSVTPMGTNARDIGHFVKYFGYSPAEALTAATAIGGELMGMPVGEIREGYFADLLLVRGDVLADVTRLEDRANLALIMKDGQIHKNILGEAPAHEGLIAAE